MANAEEIAMALRQVVQDHGVEIYDECPPLFVDTYINQNRLDQSLWPGLHQAIEASDNGAGLSTAVKEYIDNNKNT